MRTARRRRVERPECAISCDEVASIGALTDEFRAKSWLELGDRGRIRLCGFHRAAHDDRLSSGVELAQLIAYRPSVGLRFR